MSLKKQSVLLVEDDPHDVLLFGYHLKQLSLEVVDVSNGESAETYLQGSVALRSRSKRRLPSAVFLDLNLPGKSGFEVLTWIRQRSELSKLPVIVLTGSSRTIDVYRAYELGANSYLVKPADVSSLLALSDTLKLGWAAPGRETTPISHARSDAILPQPTSESSVAHETSKSSRPF